MLEKTQHFQQKSGAPTHTLPNQDLFVNIIPKLCYKIGIPCFFITSRKV